MNNRFVRRKILSAGAAGLLTAAFADKFAAAASIASPVARTRKDKGKPQDLRQRIDAALAALDRDKLVKLAMDFCNVPSPHGYEDKAARFFRDRLAEEGLTTRLQPIAPDRTNVLGTFKGSGGGRRLLFVGHLDTGGYKERVSVAPARIVDREWIEAVGIWNMKGALAAYLAAASAVRRAGIDLAGDVLIAGVAGTQDEAWVETRLQGEAHQGYSIGMKHLLEQGIAADLGVVGEPTSFKLIPQHFGVTAVRIDIVSKAAASVITIEDFVGKAGAAPPDPPPADTMSEAAEIIRALRAWIPDYQRRNSVAGKAPRVSLSAIEGGTPSMRGAASQITLFVFVSTPPRAPLNAVLEEIRTVLARTGRKEAGIEARAEIYSNDPGPFVPQDNAVVTGLQAAHTDIFGKAPEIGIVDWHSDASPLAAHGIAAVNYGPPGSLKFSRESGPQNERMSIRDLVDCARVYTALIVRICTDLASKRPHA